MYNYYILIFKKDVRKKQEKRVWNAWILPGKSLQSFVYPWFTDLKQYERNILISKDTNHTASLSLFIKCIPFSFSWVPLSRSLVGKTRKDSHKPPWSWHRWWWEAVSQQSQGLVLSLEKSLTPHNNGHLQIDYRNDNINSELHSEKTLDHKINKSSNSLLPSSFMCKV